MRRYKISSTIARCFLTAVLPNVRKFLFARNAASAAFSCRVLRCTIVLQVRWHGAVFWFLFDTSHVRLSRSSRPFQLPPSRKYLRAPNQVYQPPIVCAYAYVVLAPHADDMQVQCRNPAKFLWHVCRQRRPNTSFGVEKILVLDLPWNPIDFMKWSITQIICNRTMKTKVWQVWLRNCEHDKRKKFSMILMMLFFSGIRTILEGELEQGW
jgi:hypothetical protein